MSSSRNNGDCFEYSLIQLLVRNNYKFYDVQSEKRHIVLSNKCKQSEMNLTKLKIPFNLKDFNQIRIMCDNNGTTGNSNDFEIYNMENNKKCGISLKRNNMSIKAPRANSFGKCLPNDYTIKYKQLNDEWYQKFRSDDLTKFNKCTRETIHNFYELFIDLIVQYITKDNIFNIIKFCTSLDYTDYIIHSSKNGCFTIYINKFKPSTLDNFKVVKKQYNTFLLHFDKYCLSFRLHTASSKITPTLSLKYDVKYIKDSPLQIVK